MIQGVSCDVYHLKVVPASPVCWLLSSNNILQNQKGEGCLWWNQWFSLVRVESTQYKYPSPEHFGFNALLSFSLSPHIPLCYWHKSRIYTPTQPKRPPLLLWDQTRCGYFNCTFYSSTFYLEMSLSVMELLLSDSEQRGLDGAISGKF